MSRIRGKHASLDTVQQSKEHGNRRAFDVLAEAQTYWNNMYRFREDRERNKRYNYGDQWKDNIKFLTELVLVLNLKLFIWFKVDDDLGKMYEDLYVDADAYALCTFKGDDLHYYLHTLD